MGGPRVAAIRARSKTVKLRFTRGFGTSAETGRTSRKSAGPGKRKKKKKRGEEKTNKQHSGKHMALIRSGEGGETGIH